jgi:hypothetical protein
MEGEKESVRESKLEKSCYILNLTGIYCLDS